MGREIREDTRKKKDIPGPGIGRFNTLETTIAKKGISGFHAIPVKVAAIFAREIGRENPKVSSQQQEPLNRPRNPQENEQSMTYHTF
ncbi:hypothetical protein AC070_06280 [Fannyhessea vaginae]|nr:hypothetical protein AC070_06280 [Fannyhessea vaginae]